MQPVAPKPKIDMIDEQKVVQAMEFLQKDEVKSQCEEEAGLKQVQEYLEKQMGLDEWEMKEVMRRAGLESAASDTSGSDSESGAEECDAAMPEEHSFSSD
eukprot:SAG31_NODE_37819_length_301_cov_0.772277_1_plen_99_part_11